MQSIQDAAFNMGYTLGGIFQWLLIFAALKNVVAALFCAGLAGAKGYGRLLHGILGLIFGEFALLYMVGMPLSPEMEYYRQQQLAVVLADAGFVPDGHTSYQAADELDAD